MEHKNKQQCEYDCNHGLLSVSFGWRVLLLVTVLALTTFIFMSVFLESYQNGPIGKFLQPFNRETSFIYRAQPLQYVGEAMILPIPDLETIFSFEDVLFSTRSSHEYACRLLKEAELSQVLYAAQGMRDSVTKERMAPSAYNAYPFSLFVVVRNVEGIEPGVYHYLPETHSIRPIKFSRDIPLGGQLETSCNYTAPAVIVFSAEYGKMREKNGGDLENARRLSLQESGHISQNIYLESAALGLSTVVMANFNEREVREELGLPKTESIVYLQPIGGRVEEEIGE